MLRSIAIAVGHDSDQHVQHGNLGEESRHQEQRNHYLCLGINVRELHNPLELSNCEHVLVH